MSVAFGEYGYEQRRSNVRLTRAGFMALSVLFEITVILAVAVIAGMGYHWAVYGSLGQPMDYLPVGAMIALAYVGVFVSRGAYAIERYIVDRRGFNPVISAWNIAFMFLVLLVFLTKTSDLLSRGWAIVFYVSGLVAVATSDVALGAMLHKAVRSGLVRPRRIMLVGDGEGLRRFNRLLRSRTTGVEVVEKVDLSTLEAHPQSPADVAEDALVTEAIATARRLRIEDIVLVTDGAMSQGLDRHVDRFMELPVRVHIATSPELDRRADLSVSKVGGATTLSLTDPRMGFFQRAPKRGFDILAAGLGLVLLAPLFAIVALLIRLESPGPVFFRQRRRGFNHEEFRIWKFRTMTTMDDGDVVRQAERNDPRITRIGRILRRTNIDELPQLINVLSGDMSLVGPRPHAVAHDQDYERRIERYARRLNVKPGITGWAQVNGYRGRTATDDAMRARLACDLYYIDNRSLAFDLYIIILTVISPKAFRNSG